MVSVNEKRRRTNKIFDRIEKLAKEVEKKSKTIYNNATELILKNNEVKTTFVSISLANNLIDNSLKKIIINFEKSFEDIIEDTQDYLLEGYEIKLSKQDLKAISRSKSVIIDKLITNTTIFKNDIKAILYSNLGKGTPRYQLIKLLKELYPNYSRYAGTIINTGLSREFQDINTKKFEEVGFKWYIWAGPDDKVTRDIPCKHWVNHKFPASQLGILKSVRLILWNCRHAIIPLTEEEAKNYPDGDIAIANQV